MKKNSSLLIELAKIGAKKKTVTAPKDLSANYKQYLYNPDAVAKDLKAPQRNSKK